MEEAEYHRCVAYGPLADLIGQYLSKGRKVYAEWRLRTRKREDNSGTTRYTTEIVLDNVIFLDSRPQSGDDAPAGGAAPSEDLPF